MSHSNFLVDMWLFSIRPFRGHDYDSSAIFNMRFSRPLWKSPFQPRERIEGRDLLSSMCIEANRHHSHLCNISKIFVTGDSGSIPGSGRSPGEGNGNSILAWRIPWTEEPSRLLFMGSQELDMTERLSAHIPLLPATVHSILPKGNNRSCSYNSVAWK